RSWTGSSPRPRPSGRPARLPPNQRRSPREPGAESDQADEIVALDATALDRLVETERDGGRGGVAVLLDVVDDLLFRQVKGLLHELVDAQVRLVRDQQREVL